MSPPRKPQEQDRVFILGFAGAEIYYSTTERKIYSSLSASSTREVVGKRDERIGREGSSLDAE